MILAYIGIPLTERILNPILSGHLVSGHIDETGKISRIQEKMGHLLEMV